MKKIFSIIITIVLAFSFLNISSIESKADNMSDPIGLHNNYYYRIRLASTNLYLEAQNTYGYNSNGALLLLNERQNTNRQFFKITFQNNDAYQLMPLSSSLCGIGISNLANANTIGTNAILTSNSNNSMLKISRALNGLFQISPYSASSTAFVVSSTNINANLTLGSIAPLTSYLWIFEPVYSGTYSFFAMKRLDDIIPDLAMQSSSFMSALGYNTEYPVYPTLEEFQEILSESRIGIIFGHGRPAFLTGMDENDSIVFNYFSENYPNSQTILDDAGVWYGKDYLYIGSCEGAKDDPETNRRSLQNVAYSIGNRCVTAFYNVSTDTDKYWFRMSLILYTNHISYNYPSIYNVMLDTDNMYSIYEKAQSKCPANPSNRTTLGNTSIILDLT